MSELRAGVAEVNVTSPVGLRLVGPALPSTGVHDELYARALVLDDGESRAALVSMDICGTILSFADELRAGIADRTGISGALVHSTHTHSAPFSIPWSVLGWEEFEREGRAWREDLKSKVAEAVSRAADSLRPVTLAAGRAPAQAGMNRRQMKDGVVVMEPNPEGVIAPWVDTLRLDGGDGQPVAVLFSHAAHPVIVHSASTLISADFPGYAVQAVRRRLGDGTMAIFAQGCGANINGHPLAVGFEAAREAGDKLGEAAADAAARGEPLSLDGNPAKLKLGSLTLRLPFQDLPSMEAIDRALEAARQRLADVQQTAPENEVGIWYAREDVVGLGLLREKKAAGAQLEPLRSEMRSLAIGDQWCLLTMSHEVFVDYQIWAQQQSPYPHTMVLGYTDGCESYVPTDDALSLGTRGGYEAAPSPGIHSGLKYFQRTALRVGIEGEIKDGIQRLWAEAASGK